MKLYYFPHSATVADRTGEQLPPRVDLGVPATVAPIKASHPRRSCDELGVCQGLDPCCLCPSVRTTPDPQDAEGEPSLTPMEHIAKWAGLAFLGSCIAAVTLGGAGYIYARWFAP